MAAKEKIEVKDEVAETESVAPKSEKKSEGNQPGFFKRAFEKIKKFWKSYKSELKKITWYSRKQTFNSTLLVLVCMVIAAVFIGVIDLGFSKGIEGLGSLVGLLGR